VHEFLETRGAAHVFDQSAFVELVYTLADDFAGVCGLEFGVADTHDTSVSLVKSTICGDQCPFGFVYNPLEIAGNESDRG
jgi:hypothetical protein